MPFRAWIIAVAFGLAVASVVGWGIYQTGRLVSVSEYKHEANSSAYAAHAEQEISNTCRNGDLRTQAECIRRVVESTNEHERAESDLVAQTEMALWAFWMLIVTTIMAIITAFGVYYVWRTLVSTQEMAADTRRIGEAQVRAYLALPFRPNWKNFSPTRAPKSGFIVDNFGQTPAYNVKIGSSLEMHERFTDKRAIIDRLGRVSFRDLAETIPPRTPELSGTDPDGASRGRFRVPANMQHPISDADFNELVSPSGSRRIYLFIKIAYEDVFRRAHQTSRVFSYRHLPEQGWDEVYQEHT